MFGGTKLEAQLVDPSRADGDGRMLLDGLFPPGAPAGSVYEFGTRRHAILVGGAEDPEGGADGADHAGSSPHGPVPGGCRALPILAAIGAALVFVLGIRGVERRRLAAGSDRRDGGRRRRSSCVIGLVARKPLTAKGAETRDHLEGLKVFIEWAEADRIRMLQSPQGAERAPIDVNDPRQMLRLYEVLLPYAVVFGQEKEWAEQLAVLYGADGSPGWYYGVERLQRGRVLVRYRLAVIERVGLVAAPRAAPAAEASAGGGGGGGGGGGV